VTEITARNRASLARLLRQREELGDPSVFLDGLVRGEALGLADAARGEVTGRSAARPCEVSPHGASLPMLPSDHEELRTLALGCMRCGLSQGRTHVVFSDGTSKARLMVVGEAPGKKEDETGQPFVGPAGKLLDLLLMTIDLSRSESVYICNVLKCRPPGNRNPLPDEIESCRPFLERQIEVVSPEVILASGTFAAQWLTRSKTPLGKLRGEVYSYQGVPLVVTYHPAAILRNQGWRSATWDDFQLLRQLLDRRT